MANFARSCRWAVVAGLLLPLFARAGTGIGTWTGAENGYWTNANNWAEGKVPGFTSEDALLPTTEASLRHASSALFDGANLTGAKTTAVDLDGLVDIAYVQFTGDTQFTLGTGLSQKLPIEVGGAMAILGTKAPVIQATLLQLACSFYGYWSVPAGCDKPGIALTNNAPEELVIPGFNGYSGTTNPYESKLTLAGTGVIRTTGTVGTSQAIHLFLKFASGGKMIIDTFFGVREVVQDTTSFPQKIEIAKGGRFYSCVPTYGFFNIGWGGIEISGEGELAFGGGRFSTQEVPARWNNTPESIGAPLTVSSRVTSFCNWCPTDWCPGYTVGNSSYGSVEFTSDQNFVTGQVEIVCGTLKTTQIGLANTGGTYTHASRIGYGDISLTGSGRLQYLGAGETSDKCLSITNGLRAFTNKPVSYDPIGVIEQAGTGTLTMESPVRVLCSSGTLVLDSSVSAPAVWSGVLQNTADDQILGLEKRGTGTWTLTAANAYTGPTTLKGGTLALSTAASIASSSKLDFAGGTLEIPAYETETDVSLPSSVTVSSGASTLRVGVHAHLTLALPASATGTLDIRLETLPASVKATGLSAGDAPAYLTFNGQSVKVAADGTLEPVGSTYWKSAVSGLWSTAANWWPAAPTSNDRTFVTARDANYTVTVDADLPDMPVLTVGSGTSDATATVRLDKDKACSLTTNLLTVAQGGAFRLDEGSALVVSNQDLLAKSSQPLLIAVTNGGLLAADGGSVVLTNFSGRVTVGGAGDTETSRLVVSNGGRLVVSPRADGPAGGRERIELLENGRFEASGTSRVEFWGNHSGECDFYFDRGAMEFSESSVLYGWHGTNTVKGGGPYSLRFNVDRGSVTFRDDAQFDVNYGAVDSTVVVGNSDSKGLATLTFADRAKMARTRSGAKYGYLHVGYFGGTGVVNMASSANHADNSNAMSFYTVYVGTKSGYGELNMSAGCFNPGSMGLMVAHCGGDDKTKDSNVSGLLRLSGGALTVVGSASLSPGWGYLTPYGTIIGSGLSARAAQNHAICGRMEVSGGAFTNDQGVCWVGYGRTTGEVLQTGGEIAIHARLTYKNSVNASYGGGYLYETNQHLAVGLAGGTGRFVLSNGICRVGSRVFVGGVRTNEFRNLRATAGKYAMYSDYTDSLIGYADRHDAIGALVVAGGTFTGCNPIIVGSDGSGTLEIGPSGQLTAPELVLSNRTDSVLRYVFGSESVGSATVNRLVIAPGARLEVDFSALAREQKGSYRLLNAAAVEGSFASVTLKGTEGRPELQQAAVVVDSKGIRCRFPHGTVIFLR